ncbi:MAG: diacylglycerol kinase family protein, partial [Flavobacteriales bacterium]|nr:diacylglycerol kinase family protein [Flavobacteriales bacterium]
ALLVVLAGWLFRVSDTEWMILLLCIATVIAAELFNTAIENLCDMVEPNYNKKIGFIKDAAAGAVLIVTIAAVIIGLIIFIPKLICLWPC